MRGWFRSAGSLGSEMPSVERWSLNRVCSKNSRQSAGAIAREMEKGSRFGGRQVGSELGEVEPRRNGYFP